MKKKAIVVGLIIIFTGLWFSDILPPKVAEITAFTYMVRQENGNDYKIKGSDYSNAHDCFFVYFENEDRIGKRNVGIYYRFFPFDVYYDSDYPG